MKYLFLFFFIINIAAAEEGEWEAERINFYFENDVFFGTDSDYTDGSRLSILMYRPDADEEWLKIPFLEGSDRVDFISFSLTQKIFTPDDLLQKELIEDDRPYAGWLYFEMGLHQSSETDLDSLMIQAGVVGPASGMEELQHFIHKLIGSEIPQGWDNQLKNEAGIQLNYQHKWRYVPEPLWGIESSVVPYLGGELGNVAIKANAGVLLRFGWNVPEDFGSSAINGASENGIPVRRRCLFTPFEPWSFSLSFSAGGSVVARDIFLDGNSFRESHSVEKNFLKGFGSFGFSGRYKNYNIDYIGTYNSKEFKTEDSSHSVGSIIFSYIYSL
ncbi:lipid A deacylase LpxR family protein [Sulfurimonas sp. HSL3-7]|uniref:lipid A deacylase LpxR family protein n=1 Tax=Sulfonitrofixus jiaomeiensis TaxID=3131938 RepID=UPI0031FA177C